MRLVLAIVVLFAFASCSDATPEDACGAVETLCNGNPDFEKARQGCEEAAENASQEILNCVDSAETCAAALACTTSSS